MRTAFDDDWARGRVTAYVAGAFGRDPLSIRPTDRLIDFAEDSLDLVEFIAGAEEELDVELIGDEVETVQDLIDRLRDSGPER